MKLSRSASSQSILAGSVLLSVVIGFLCTGFIHTNSVHVGMDSVHAHATHGMSLKTCCDTSLSDHMELWKRTFVGIPQNLHEILASAWGTLLVSITLAYLFLPPHADNLLFSRYRQYEREHPDIPTYDALRLAFARGILHPKAYSFA